MSGRYDKAIVSVVVDKALYSFDNEFDYYLPQGVKASVGQRVIVPFGKGGKKRVGLVTGFKQNVIYLIVLLHKQKERKKRKSYGKEKNSRAVRRCVR